jgi:hypothetical protein
MLVAGSHGIVRLDAAGEFVRFYDVLRHHGWTGIALSPDGTSFWAAAWGTSALVEFDLDSGALLRGPIDTGTEEMSAVGVCVFGEPAAAREHACENTADDDGDGAADCADPDCAIRAPCDPSVTTTTTTSTSTTTTLPAPPPSQLDHQGTDFVLGFIQNDEVVPNDAVVKLYLTSTVATEVTVQYPFHPPTQFGQTQFTTRVAVTPGSYTVVDVPGAASHGWSSNGRNNLVHAFGPDEFAVHMVTIGSRGFAGAALALPVDALGTEYVVTTYGGDGLGSVGSQFVVAAALDDTRVTITPSANAIPSLPAGVPRVFQLDRGEGLRVQAALGTLDLTGTTISADRPVGVTAGNSATYLGTSTNFDLDHLFEVALPVERWGRETLVADRPQSPFGSVYRVVAAADGTTVTLDARTLGTIDRGQFIDTGLVFGDHRFLADRPVAVTQLITSGSPHLSDGRGDPSMASVPPIAHYRSAHTFAVVHEDQFFDGWVTVIAESGDLGTITLDGAPIPAAAFEPIWGSCFSVARLPLAVGVHTTRSTGVHGVTVEGFATNGVGSHLFPAGVALASTEPACGTTWPRCRCDAIAPACRVTLEQRAGGAVVIGTVDESGGREDRNDDGVLDAGEDLNRNGHLDEESGIASIELAAGAVNLALTVHPFVPGDAAAGFTVEAADPGTPASGTVVAADVAGNRCQERVELGGASSTSTTTTSTSTTASSSTATGPTSSTSTSGTTSTGPVPTATTSTSTTAPPTTTASSLPATSSTTTTTVPPGEVCDDCVDDDGDGAVDRDDPDCPAAATGDRLGLGDARLGRAVVRCQRAIREAGSRFVEATLGQYHRCAVAALRCAQQKPGDQTCLARAAGRCRQAAARSRTGEQRLRQRIAGRCRQASLAALLDVSGLAYSAEARTCAGAGVPALATIDGVAACVGRQHRCRAEQLVAQQIPRITSLLASSGVDLGAAHCLGDGPGPRAPGLAGSTSAGRSVPRCQAAIGAAGRRLVRLALRRHQRCAGRVFECLQRRPDDTGCLARARRTCGRQVARVDQGPTSDLAKATGAIRRACGPEGGVTLPDLLGAGGLDYDSLAARCAGLGVRGLESAGAVAACVVRQHLCRVEQLLEAETPRLHELLDLGGVGGALR